MWKKRYGPPTEFGLVVHWKEKKDFLDIFSTKTDASEVTTQPPEVGFPFCLIFSTNLGLGGPIEQRPMHNQTHFSPIMV